MRSRRSPLFDPRVLEPLGWALLILMIFVVSRCTDEPDLDVSTEPGRCTVGGR